MTFPKRKDKPIWANGGGTTDGFWESTLGQYVAGAIIVAFIGACILTIL